MTRSRLPISDKVERFFIRSDVLAATSAHFKEKAKSRHEAYVFWAGSVPNGFHGYIACCIIPRVRTSPGRVSVGLNKLLEINRELSKRDMLLLCQLHTHPGDFGHSSGDERQSVSYRLGFISIVIPNYGRDDLTSLDRCYTYEYEGNWKWRRMTSEEVKQRFYVEEATVSI